MLVVSNAGIRLKQLRSITLLKKKEEKEEKKLVH